MKCPRCKKTELHPEPIMNATSHHDRTIFICDPCGEEEAMIEVGTIETNQVEIDFVQSLKDKP